MGGVFAFLCFFYGREKLGFVCAGEKQPSLHPKMATRVHLRIFTEFPSFFCGLSLKIVYNKDDNLWNP